MGSDSINELMAVVDSTVPVPQRDIDKLFLMYCEVVHTIPGRGTVTTGRIETGSIRKGEEVVIEGYGESIKTTLTGIETFHKQMESGEAGDHVGCLIRGLKRDECKRGMAIARPNTVTSHNCVDVKLYLLTKDEGGRSMPIMNLQQLTMYCQTWHTRVQMDLLGKDMMMPGDDSTVKLNMDKAMVLLPGQRFTLRNSGITVGTGVITKTNANMTKEEHELMIGGKRARERLERLKEREAIAAEKKIKGTF